MTIIQAINYLDYIRPNSCPQELKISWLSMLDGKIKSEIIDTHEGGENILFDGYDKDTDISSPLLVQAPYDMIYVKFLEAQIDEYEGEAARYACSYATFNHLFSCFERYYNKTHMPRSRKIKYF